MSDVKLFDRSAKSHWPQKDIQDGSYAPILAPQKFTSLEVQSVHPVKSIIWSADISSWLWKKVVKASIEIGRAHV